MSNGNHIQDELNGLNSQLPGGNPYSVPEGYFEGLAARMLNKVKASEESAAMELETLSPLLASIPRTMPYSLPQAYFTTNTENLGYVHTETQLSIDKAMPYALPEGYFDALPELMLNRVKPAKVIPMVRRRWMRLAVAAAITGIIGVSGFFFLSNRDASIDPAKPIAQQLKNVSTSELDEFIKTTDITPASPETATTKKSKADVEIKEMLNGVSDKELDAFLNQVPTEDEDLTVIN